MAKELNALSQNSELGKNKATEDITKKKKNTAIEGGWGYVVCFGMVISFIAGMGHINSFGLIYNDFMNDTHSTAKSLTSAQGVFAMMLAIGGMILNVLSKVCSLRQGGFIGAALISLGSILTIFITNINQLPFTFGVLQGIGFGIIVPVSYSTLNFYFVRKRTTVMSACKAIQGFVLMWYPQLIKKLIIQYGFRGTLLLISAISLHTIPGMAVMTKSKKNVRNMAANDDVESRRNIEENVDLLDQKENEEPSGVKNKINKARFILEEVFCLKVLKDPVYVNICLGQSFVNFSDLMFFMLQPMLLFQYGYNRSEVATCISIGAGADVAGRGALALLSSIISIETRTIFYMGSFFTLVMRVVLFQVRQFTWVSTVTAVLGFLRAWLHVTSPLVISSHVPHQDFPGAYALYLLTAGVVNMIVSPMIGQLKDTYEDFTPAFYALCICCLPCLVLWPLEYFWQGKMNKTVVESNK
ncbi:monocarboxylate transporter 14-like [Ostrinia nubilalis]|uniref:monocarboxylate transporter 14-like n=1 Tax=Ostrinia nubilalis TaxID=29057 RepID=UPI0030823122